MWARSSSLRKASARTLAVMDVDGWVETSVHVKNTHIMAPRPSERKNLKKKSCTCRCCGCVCVLQMKLTFSTLLHTAQLVFVLMTQTIEKRALSALTTRRKCTLRIQQGDSAVPCQPKWELRQKKKMQISTPESSGRKKKNPKKYKMSKTKRQTNC